jgi:hypothetical protein
MSGCIGAFGAFSAFGAFMESSQRALTSCRYGDGETDTADIRKAATL